MNDRDATCEDIPVGTYVRIKKLEESELIDFPAGDPKTWKYGAEDNGNYSLPNGYEILGHLLCSIAVGRRILVKRTHRNGVEVLGDFESSPVVSIESNIVVTRNSRYLIEVAPSPSTEMGSN